MSRPPAENGDADTTSAGGRVAAARGRAIDAPDESLADRDRDELVTLVTELRSENERLREEYARTRRADYRRSAIGLLVLGVLGVLGGLTLPLAREVLFVLGAIGLFGGVLTWFLTPARFVTATVGESVYDAAAATGAQLRDELGLQETSVYVPVPRADETDPPVRLFVPQARSFELPESPQSLFVAPDAADRRGVSVRPTAATLLEAFASSVALETEPGPLAEQLAEGLVEQFELVDAADVEVDADVDAGSGSGSGSVPAAGRVTVAVEGSAYDAVSDFDHPVASFLGAGLARGLDRPVALETRRADGRTLVTCRWGDLGDDANERPDTAPTDSDRPPTAQSPASGVAPAIALAASSASLAVTAVFRPGEKAARS